MKDRVSRLRRSRYNLNTGRRKRAQFGSLGAVAVARRECQIPELALPAHFGFAGFFASWNWTTELFFRVKWLLVLSAIGSLMTNTLNQKH
jgi:hypothetical protein